MLLCPHSILHWDLRTYCDAELNPKPSLALTSSKSLAVSHCGQRQLALLWCLSHQIALQVAVVNAGGHLCWVGSQGHEETVPWGQPG